MFIVIELQKLNDTQVANNVWAYGDEQGNVAESKYHDVLRAAAVSAMPVHSAVIVDEQGRTVKGPEAYKHGVAQNE